jgi:hypothetical protein
MVRRRKRLKSSPNDRDRKYDVPSEGFACWVRGGCSRGIPISVWYLHYAVLPVALDPSQPLGQLYHTSWNAKDGLNGSITALAQTQNGFLWIGTSDGLIRFDGLSFEPCKPEVGSLISIAGPIEVRVRAADCHTSRSVF